MTSRSALLLPRRNCGRAAGGKVDTGNAGCPGLVTWRGRNTRIGGMRRARAHVKKQPWIGRKKSGRCGGGGGEGDHPMQLVQPTSELSRCTCSIFPWIRRLMAVADNVGPIVFPPFPFLSLSLFPPSFSLPLACGVSSSKHHEDLPLLRITSTACVGTHMSRIPTVLAFDEERERESEREREREQGRHASPSPCGREAEKKDEGCTDACCGVASNDRHVHSRARPFAALSRGPHHKTCPHDGSDGISAPLFVRDTRASRRFGQPGPRRDPAAAAGLIGLSAGMLMRNLDRSAAEGESFGAMSHDNVASPFAASNYGETRGGTYVIAAINFASLFRRAERKRRFFSITTNVA